VFAFSQARKNRGVVRNCELLLHGSEIEPEHMKWPIFAKDKSREIETANNRVDLEEAADRVERANGSVFYFVSWFII